jgi:hypothetical protein
MFTGTCRTYLPSLPIPPIAHRFSGGFAIDLDKSPGHGRTGPSATIVPSPGDLPERGDDPTAKAVGYWQNRNETSTTRILGCPGLDRRPRWQDSTVTDRRYNAASSLIRIRLRVFGLHLVGGDVGPVEIVFIRAALQARGPQIARASGRHGNRPRIFHRVLAACILRTEIKHVTNHQRSQEAQSTDCLHAICPEQHLCQMAQLLAAPQSAWWLWPLVVLSLIPLPL